MVTFGMASASSGLPTHQILWILSNAQDRIQTRRIGASKSAIKARRRTWQASGNLIVFLFDEQLTELLACKARGEDPTEVINEQLDDFFLALAP
jgi:hypothetical protein